MRMYDICIRHALGVNPNYWLSSSSVSFLAARAVCACAAETSKAGHFARRSRRCVHLDTQIYRYVRSIY